MIQENPLNASYSGSSLILKREHYMIFADVSRLVTDIILQQKWISCFFSFVNHVSQEEERSTSASELLILTSSYFTFSPFCLCDQQLMLMHLLHFNCDLETTSWITATSLSLLFLHSGLGSSIMSKCIKRNALNAHFLSMTHCTTFKQRQGRESHAFSLPFYRHDNWIDHPFLKSLSLFINTRDPSWKEEDPFGLPFFRWGWCHLCWRSQATQTKATVSFKVYSFFCGDVTSVQKYQEQKKERKG